MQLKLLCVFEQGLVYNVLSFASERLKHGVILDRKLLKECEDLR